MNQKTTEQFAALERDLATTRLGVGADEVHGTLVGWLCGGGRADPADWLALLHWEAAAAAPATALQARLAALAREAATALEDTDDALQLLLAAPDADVERRARGLVAWCRGFLGGFGLTGVRADALEPGMDVFLRDLADIAVTEPEVGDPAEDRAALEELEQHVRFGARLLYAQLHPPPGAVQQ